MPRGKKLGILGLVVVLVGLSWYFFIKGYNYRITFKTPHAPGTVYSAISEMQQWQLDGLDSVYITKKDPFKSTAYNFHYGDSLFNIKWKINRINDTLTKVTGMASDLNNSFSQNLSVPFKNTDFVKRNVKLATRLMNSLYVHENDYKVTIPNDSLVKVASQYCACISLKSEISDKGKAMISHISVIMNYIRDNELTLAGDPFLEVIEWDKDTMETISDFCFPINESDSLPPSNAIKFKNSKEFMALKAIFNGNYRLSDRAWYELIDLAEQRGIAVRMAPFEIYRNDPHSGGDELNWVAEVYLPVIEQ